MHCRSHVHVGHGVSICNPRNIVTSTAYKLLQSDNLGCVDYRLWWIVHLFCFLAWWRYLIDFLLQPLWFNLFGCMYTTQALDHGGESGCCETSP